MKKRKPLKPGDQVKFFGISDNGYRCQEYCTVMSQEGLNLTVMAVCLPFSTRITIDIDRRQVTHVKRKVKKVRREFYIRSCPVNVNNDWYVVRPDPAEKPILLCKDCKIIKVREVKE